MPGRLEQWICIALCALYLSLNVCGQNMDMPANGSMPMGNQDPMNTTGHGHHGNMGGMGGMGNNTNHGNMSGMGGSHGNHSNMGNMTDHAGHGNMGNTTDHGNMDHGNMDHGNMDHGNMDHGNMDHGNMDHGNMDHGNMDHGSTDTTGHGGHNTVGHSQYFYAGVDSIILFEEWMTDSNTKLIGACVAVGVAGMLYEGFKVLREKLLYKATSQKYSKSSGCQLCDCMHIVQSFLHILQIAISYSLMLVFMTFNVWLCLALCVGAGVGYWLFHSQRHAIEMNDINEHCN